MGGPIGACDEADYPFLPDELRLLEACLEANSRRLEFILAISLWRGPWVQRFIPRREERSAGRL
jgi:hypothetical protein